MNKTVRNLLADDLLIAVDVQNDFCPGGALEVRHGDGVVSAINALAFRFPHLILTQDWHPRGHVSFSSSHAGRKPFETVTLRYGEQTLWPDHCVQGTWGAELHPGLEAQRCELVLRKGHNPRLDSYSAFFENDHETPTGLAGYISERGFRRLYVAGLATDFCVHYTAVDGRRLGFEVVVLEDACRGIDLDGSLGAAWSAMAGAGVHRLRTSDLRFPQ